MIRYASVLLVLILHAGSCQAQNAGADKAEQADPEPKIKPVVVIRMVGPDGVAVELTEEQQKLLGLGGGAQAMNHNRVAETWTLLSFFLIPPIMWLMSGLHESAHALCAWLLGWRVFRVVVGSGGRPLLRFRLARVRWEFHFVPLAGLVEMAPKHPDRYRLKAFMIYLCGPLVSLAGVVVSFWLPMPADSLPAWLLFGAPNLVILIHALLPGPLTTADGQEWLSDGQILFRIPSVSDAHVLRMHDCYFYLEGTECFQDRHYQDASAWHERALELYPDEVNNRLGLALALAFLKDHTRAREQWSIVLSNTSLPAETRQTALNNIAWADLLLGGEALLDEADRFTRQTMQETPIDSAYRPIYLGTRGCYLIERGEADEGLPLVRQAFTANVDPRFKALNACYIALGEIQLGHWDEAEAAGHTARQLDPACFLLENVDERLNKWHTGIMPTQRS